VDLLLEATFRAERDHFWFRGFRRFVQPLIDEAAGGRRDLTMLDCGCGTGVNLALLEPYGRAVGIDLTMRGLEFGRSRGWRRLAQATAVRLPFRDAQFDLVTSFDVIYSLSDEDEPLALAEMARVVRPHGALVVNVAAMPLLRGNHSVLALERRRYTRAMLSTRLERAGFRATRLTYTNASLFPLMLATRLSQRALGFATREDEAGAEIAIPARPLNAALSALLGAEARLVRHVSLPFGSSLLALARKD
jgi:ubiquinone/menaquinone biosynthesis C-methylase UbiE